jgi:phospholipid/cholesterol/gamma-HCH transport system substrate-binding protein
MSQSRLETKVGLFALLGLVLLAVLAILFSKGTSFYQRTFMLRLKSSNVSGIKVGANVLVAGVQVGRASGVDLDPDGRTVTIHLRIYQRYQIYEDARFEIEASGFLGDQIIAIYPGANAGRLLQNGDEVRCRTPFNIQEAVAQAMETLSHIGEATTNLNAAVSDVRRYALTPRTLTNLAGAVDRFALLSEDAGGAISNLNALVTANAQPVASTVSNLNVFSGQLSPLAGRANDLLSNNTTAITVAVRNIETASGQLTNLLHELQTGRGPAGRILHDEEMAENISEVARNLAITSSNLNRVGLWGILRKPKEPRTNELAPAVLRSPHDSDR